MQNPVSISIGIPAHNEEENIKRLLSNILNQKQVGFTLDAVYIISDGSQDHTADEVRSVNDNRIYLVVNESRKGQAQAQNMIFALASSDIVVIFEADTNPRDTNYLAELIDPIIANDNIGLVQGNLIPLPARTLFGRIIKAQIDIYCGVSIKDRDAHAWIVSGRGGRAFARHVYKKMVWPNAVPEDAYALLWCRTNDIPTVFQKSAVCHFRCSETFADFLKERAKIVAGKKVLKDYFAADEMRGIFSLPRRLRMRMLTEFILRHPFYAAYYLCLLVALILVQDSRPFSDFWDMTISTKKL